MRFIQFFPSVIAILLISLTNLHAENLTIGLASEPTSIDPHFHNIGTNNALSLHAFERLIAQDEKQQHFPGLATSWRALDETTWEFKLREGVTFHDGSPFNADDVVCSFKRAGDVPNSPSSFGVYTKGKVITKLDDFTIQITTDGPYPLLPNDVSNLPIVSQNTGCTSTTDDFNSGKTTIGTGPYVFQQYRPGESVTYRRYENYWGELPHWSQVELRIIKSGPGRVAALLAGDLDMISAVPTTDIVTLKNSGFILSQSASNRVIFLHMDQFREVSPFVTAQDGTEIKNPLLDPRVRNAISVGIDRKSIIDNVMEGIAIPAGQLVPETFFGASSALKPPPFDPDMARAILAEAGYPDGFKMTIHGPNDRYINDEKIAEAIAQMLSRIGITMSVETMPRSVYFNRASVGSPDGQPEFSFILVGWGAGSGEASSPLKGLVHSYDKSRGLGSSNRGRYSNAAFDAKLQEALGTINSDERHKLLGAAMELAISDAAVIPLHFQVNTWAMRPELVHTARTDEFTIATGVAPQNE